MRKRAEKQTEDLRVRKVGKVIKKINITPNDALVVRAGSGFTDTPEQRDLLAKEILKVYGFPVLVCTVSDMDEIEKLDEKAMHSFGWFRIPGDPRRLLKQEEEKETDDEH